MSVPHPIPYQGSKRKLAPFILQYMPPSTPRLIEPFAGSAAVSIAAVLHGKAERILLNDSNAPLMAVWEAIINRPGAIARQYELLWEAQQGDARIHYDRIRDEFNKTKRPDYLLYLLARCVKGAVRYNSEGQFNQSPDNRRLGMRPEKMRRHIMAASQALHGKAEITNVDYNECLERVPADALVYMDPPYQGVCDTRDHRYLRGFDTVRFIRKLEYLNQQRVPYALSYDGKTGTKIYGKPMPEDLGLVRVEIEAGVSSQATLLGRSDVTTESIYLSPSLVRRIGHA